jgi:hypothetical protein
MTFDPNSNDALFAKVLAKLDEQSAMLTEVRENSRLIESEMAGLKSWRDNFEGKITILAALVSVAGGLLVSLVLHFIK